MKPRTASNQDLKENQRMEVESILNSQEPSEIQIPMCAWSKAHRWPQSACASFAREPSTLLKAAAGTAGLPRKPCPCPSFVHISCHSCSFPDIHFAGCMPAVPNPSFARTSRARNEGRTQGVYSKPQEKLDFLLPSHKYR